jgi:hypothetical protein
VKSFVSGFSKFEDDGQVVALAEFLPQALQNRDPAFGESP